MLNKMQKVLAIIILSCILIILSVIFHEFTRTKLHFINICFYIIIIATSFSFVVCFLQQTNSFLKNLFAKKAQKLWIEISNNAHNNVVHYINKGKDLLLPIAIILTFLYQYDKEASEILLNKLKMMYDKDDKNKTIISYILLNNCSNNEVTETFDNNARLKQQCEILSKGSIQYIVDFDIQNNEINKNLVVGLLHSCLYNSNLPKDKIISLLRSISSWISKKAITNNIDENDKDTTILLVMLLPLIKNKLHSSNIDDYYIKENLHDIEHSKWLMKLIHNSYNYISKGLDEINTEDLLKDDCIKHICMVCAYYNNLSLKMCYELYYKIKRKKYELRLHLESDEIMLLFILYAMPIKMFKSDDDLIYELASIVCLCAGQFI